MRPKRDYGPSQGPVIAEYRPERVDFGSDKADFKPHLADFRTERACFGSEWI